MMKAQHIFVMLMVIFQLSYISASQSGSLMDNIESSVNSFHQCYMISASGEQDQQGEQKQPEEEEEEEEPDCD